MLRKIIGPRREAVTRDWTSLHNGELYDLYSSPNITQVIKSEGDEMGRVCGRYGGEDIYTGFNLET